MSRPPLLELLSLTEFSNHFRQSLLLIFLDAAAALVLTVYPAIAQEGADTVKQTERRWLVTLSFGITSSGPAADIEKAMNASQFNQTLPAGLFGGPTAHPFSRIPSISWVTALRYSMSPLIDLGLIISNAPMWETHGYSNPDFFLYINSSVFTIAPTASLKFIDILHFGIGPALFVTTVNQGGGLEDISQSATKVGFLLDAGLAVPARSSFFFNVSLQYRLVGKVTIGPYVSRLSNDGKTMPSSNVNYNHLFIAAGMGLRL